LLAGDTSTVRVGVQTGVDLSPQFRQLLNRQLLIQIGKRFEIEFLTGEVDDAHYGGHGRGPGGYPGRGG
jgi:hypothetical protein